jgi:hypothetical protein
MAVDDRPIQVVDAPIKAIRYGPWKGSIRSMPSDRVPPEFMAESDSDTPSSNYSFNPHYGTWFRRLGQTIKFDTLPTAAGVGLLPAKWGARCRQLEEFASDGISDGVPTIAALLTKETINSGLDDGRFSNFYVRDQVGNANYTVGSEYSATTYPTPGTTQVYRYIPLMHDSGDGGMTRGIDEFTRRLFFCGSRGYRKVSNWHYFPDRHGTPARLLLNSSESSEGSPVLATGDGTNAFWLQSVGGQFRWYIGDLGGGFTTGWQSLAASEDTEAKSIFVNNQALINLPATSQVTCPTMTATSTTFIYRMRMRLSTAYAGDAVVTVDVTTSDANRYRKTFNVKDVPTPGSWVNMDLTYNTATDGFATSTANTVNFLFSTTADFSPGLFITYGAFITVGAGSTSVTRLIPSGPIPPTHSGTLAPGNAVSGSSAAIFERPDADDTDDSWVNSVGNGTDLYSYIDESTTDDTDYIKSPANTSTVCIVRLSDFTAAPTAGDTVTITVRAKFTGSVFLNHTFGTSITEGGVSRGGSNFTLSTSFANYSYTLTPTQISAVTSWSNLKMTFSSICGVGNNIFVSQAFVSTTPGQSAGAWQGSDRFFYGLAYRFEDDSVWMPTIPRFVNQFLTTGYNLFTVDANNPTVSYGTVEWTNIPVPPFSIKAKLLLRTDKIDSTLTDSLALNPFGLKIIAEIDAATTTYTDTFADDDSLQLDPDALLIRWDHIMPPAARYIFSGDMRVCHSYGRLNPAAIVIAPIGRTADYDLNFSDGTASIYNNDASYMQIARDSSGDGALTLIQTTGTAVTDTKTFDFDTYLTLENLVDGINATSCASDGQQWRAQLCPGVNPAALCETDLLPHSRVIASCVVAASTALTKSAGGLSKIAIGSRVGMANVTAGTYVTKIVSDTELTLSAAATGSGTADATFMSWFGDAPTAATTNSGWQRVISNSLPGFLYFNKTYLDQFPFEKSSVWMTTASPGSNKSAPNCFSGKLSNKFFPPTGRAGKSMGGVGIRQGFRVLFENQRGIIDNTAQTGSGIDEQYRLKITHETSGCCSWASVAAGTNFAVYAAPEGIIAGDLQREILLSDAIWNPPASDSPTGSGDFSYEIPKSIAATAADTDNAMLYCSIIRDVLRVNYRTASSTTHPDRQVVYDYSSGIEAAGIEALFRNGKEPWGWSVPFTRAVTCVGEGRRTDGAHVYGWNDANAQSTGDGRVDEIDTTQTDNGTAISASMTTPWLRPGSRKRTFHRFVAEHATPSGATCAFDFHRSIADETYSLTPSTSSALYIRDWKELTLPARAPTSAGFFGFRQSAGTAQEIRSLEVYVEELDTYA